MRTSSPLRYPGGKGVLLGWISNLLRQNNLIGGNYVESYAGGAGLAFGLILNGLVDRIFINDFDRTIYAIWDCILNDTDDFIAKINNTQVNLKEWQVQKDIIKNQQYYSNLELGFAAFFLNRTNVSGIINGGPIGGMKQGSKYTIDCRFNKKYLIQKIIQIADKKSSIEIFNLDALEFIRLITKRLSQKSLLYLDPPYYKKGPELYRNFYQHGDHIKLSQILKDINLPLLLTYDNCDEIRELYAEFEKFDFNLRYSASLKQKSIGSELMIFKNLKMIDKPNLIKGF
ncbi:MULTISPECIES: DNA adenine methylase [unclassified Campylobacter]|uniref:DNA adenine methylase n=1 Tax=unclassified Campylobacter TaxID=2593542 RepID=UPI001472B7FE|nr:MULTISPECIES: DNA adenine methylase [unclassified Campylobacter]